MGTLLVLWLITILDKYSLFDLNLPDCCSQFSSYFVDWWTRLLHLSVSEGLSSGGGRSGGMRTVFACIGTFSALQWVVDWSIFSVQCSWEHASSVFQVSSRAFQLSFTEVQFIVLHLRFSRGALEYSEVHCSAQVSLSAFQWNALLWVHCTSVCSSVQLHRWGANYRANRKHPSWMETAPARTCQCFALLLH